MFADQLFKVFTQTTTHSNGTLHNEPNKQRPDSDSPWEERLGDDSRLEPWQKKMKTKNSTSLAWWQALKLKARTLKRNLKLKTKYREKLLQSCLILWVAPGVIYLVDGVTNFRLHVSLVSGFQSECSQFYWTLLKTGRQRSHHVVPDRQNDTLPVCLSILRVRASGSAIIRHQP